MASLKMVACEKMLRLTRTFTITRLFHKFSTVLPCSEIQIRKFGIKSFQFQQAAVALPEKPILTEEDIQLIYEKLRKHPDEMSIILEAIKKQLRRKEMSGNNMNISNLTGCLSKSQPWVRNFLSRTAELKDFSLLYKYYSNDLEVLDGRVLLRNERISHQVKKMVIDSPETKRVVFTSMKKASPWLELLTNSPNSVISFDGEWGFHDDHHLPPKIIQLCNGWLTLIIYIPVHAPPTRALYNFFRNSHITKFGFAINSDIKKLSSWFCQNKLEPLAIDKEMFGIVEADSMTWGLSNLLKFGVEATRMCSIVFEKQHHTFHKWDLKHLNPIKPSGMNHLEYATSDVLCAFYYLAHADLGKDNQDINHWATQIRSANNHLSKGMPSQSELATFYQLSLNDYIPTLAPTLQIPLFFDKGLYPRPSLHLAKPDAITQGEKA